MPLVATMEDCLGEQANPWTTAVFLQTLGVTVVMTCAFVLTKTTYDRMRRRLSQVAVVVIGAGPIGLTSALVAAHSQKASRVIVYEEKPRSELLCRPQQIGLDAKSVTLLSSLGVDFDNIEGCWKHKNFFTRIGVFQEYLLSQFQLLQTPVELKLKTKVLDKSRHISVLGGLSLDVLMHRLQA
ncbi:hypothetical protein CAPTEDRAFT_195876 [Capitella teleta]|uniref:FAD-binding domain-containing protein n=1 Tax=Capitella teleta TaxID=283909 RepID=R7TBV3_CAPTE|nr:hypothetical protein CAPTEDRAFT_195876 [Capitella teleta]|eukprot:ELT88967.1 hypothetical protein CAPTEDRAFT_195876 [Capitella teleta]